MTLANQTSAIMMQARATMTIQQLIQVKVTAVKPQMTISLKRI